jgi:hypothetical protein
VAQWTFRVSFAIPAVGTLWLVYYRTWKMPLASRTLMAAKKKAAVTGYDAKALSMTFKHFGGRLIATAGAVGTPFIPSVSRLLRIATELLMNQY